MSELNLATLWEALSDAMGPAPAVIQADATRTWQDFDDRAAKVAGALLEQGLSAGDKVALDLYNSIEFLEIVFAVLKVGAVPVPINYRYREAELAYLIDNSGSKVVFFHEALADRVLAAAGLAGYPVKLIAVADGSPEAPGVSRYEELIVSAEPMPRVSRDASAELIVYTGGTTGYPKGAVWQHRDLIGGISTLAWGRAGIPEPQDVQAAVAIAVELAGQGQSPTVLAVPPLMHATSLFESTAALMMGGTVVLCSSRSLDADEILSLIQEHGIKRLSIVGSAFADPILNAAERAAEVGQPYDLSSLQRVTSSGLIWSTKQKLGMARHWRG